MSRATVQILTAQQAVVANGATDAQGNFSLASVPAGDYVLLVSRPGLSERRFPIHLGPGEGRLEVILDTQPATDSVTVTAVAGRVASTADSPQSVNVVDRDEIQQRAKTVLAQVANEETGVDLQRTSPTIGGIFVRGLTGNKVNVFIDGVRYSTSAMRGGINTFLNLIEPSSVDTVEILRGPNSAQYGSDALGGSVQFVSPAPVFTDRPGFHGELSNSFNSSDAGFGSNLSSSYTRSRFGLLTNFAGHRASRLRTGGGVDSRSAITRFLGLPSTVLYEGRMPDSAFTQYAGMARLYWRAGADSQFIAHYQRSQQDGGKRPDQLLGGDGNLIADLRNLMLDFLYVRYDKQRLGWLDQFAATYSYNAQREERVNQGGNGNPRAAINHEYERTSASGIQVNAGKQFNPNLSLFLGGDFYREQITAPSYGYDPVTNVFSPRRPRVPDRSVYHNGGVYLQKVADLVPRRLRLIGNVRYTAASYRSRAADSPLIGGRPLWPNDSLRVHDFSFKVGAVGTVRPGLNLVANVSRGFRAPHVTDLGTLGLTGSGFEVAAPDVAGLGGVVGSTAGPDAVSTGTPVAQVKPESSLSYEGGARFVSAKVSGEAIFFVNDINDNITKQALILPAGSAGQFLGGERITAQNANGVVFVGASPNPVLVRTNFDHARIYGIESRLEVKPARGWFIGGLFTYLYARDERTGLAPNIEGGTPPANGYLRVRYTPGGGRFWLEPFIHAAYRQDRLSSLDLQDRRIGAARSRGSIANFFNNGAAARGLVAGGILLPTRETLVQVQDRILGRGISSAPLFTTVPGYVTLNLRAGYRLGERQDLLLEFENMTDRNYRGISWGVDAPGRGMYLRYSLRF